MKAELIVTFQDGVGIKASYMVDEDDRGVYPYMIAAALANCVVRAVQGNTEFDPAKIDEMLDNLGAAIIDQAKRNIPEMLLSYREQSPDFKVLKP